MTARRLLSIVAPMCLLLAGAYTAWIGWHVQQDLTAAEVAAQQLRVAWQGHDDRAQRAAGAELGISARAAWSRTGTAWWGMLTHLPVVGDDADGVRALSRSLDTIASGAVVPLSQTVGALDGVAADGRLDVARIRRLQGPVDQAQQAVAQADGDLDRNSDGYVAPLRSRYRDFADVVHSLSSGLTAATTAVDLAPGMLGADGPRNYLVIFQNNAEIRSTGGLPGSWALVRARAGRLVIVDQGAGSDFPVSDEVARGLTADERAFYGAPLGQYFLDAGWTPDFPRAAELWRAHWRLAHPTERLDGVVAIDPVGLSYLLRGTGPVTVGGVALTADNIVDRVLSRPYLDLPVQDQDPYFQAVARAVLTRLTGHVDSPVALTQGLDRAVAEGRLLVSSFEPRVQRRLAAAPVSGAMTTRDRGTPHLDIGLNDLTGSKMSYYLRARTAVTATGCQQGVQRLDGSLTLRQDITPAAAAKLPAYVTGGGAFGTEVGSQYVMVRVFGPWKGAVGDLRLNGKKVIADLRQVDGRPAAAVDVLLSTARDVRITWTASTRPGQTRDTEVTTTPTAAPGVNRFQVRSAC